MTRCWQWRASEVASVRLQGLPRARHSLSQLAPNDQPQDTTSGKTYLRKGKTPHRQGRRAKKERKNEKEQCEQQHQRRRRNSGCSR